MFEAKLENATGYTIRFTSGESRGVLADRISVASGVLALFKGGELMAIYPLETIVSVLHYAQEYEFECADARSTAGVPLGRL